MPYIAKLEKAGIPTVLIDLPDQDGAVKTKAMENGIPNARYIHASRILPGPEDSDMIIKPAIEALTKPLTKKEKESGHWQPPAQQRILFTGTLDDAQEFYQQTEKLPERPNAR